MQYIYLLTNVHVPKLVKFGFSRRDSRLRAAELSAATGVPGKWEVHHFWEVEDGYGVEQEVFFQLADKRLGKKEFLEMEPKEAIAEISAVIADVGINPTARAKAEAERAEIERTRMVAERVAARDVVAAIDVEIHRISRPAQDQAEQLIRRRNTVAGWVLTLIAFVLGVSIGYAAGVNPLSAGVAAVVVGWLLPFPLLIDHILKRGTPNRQDVDRLYTEARRKVLAKHKLTEETYGALNRMASRLPYGDMDDYTADLMVDPERMLEDWDEAEKAMRALIAKDARFSTLAEPKPRLQ
ncbi:GIY-YIG nuclease family protein [Noviherbaspirillum malthae]|uniref:GIY-YIG nuclease family protein n=1 Tax=Noviherbaspirillum malthae TaxID=1260987 RepID=UPI00188EBF27|nr:GIY-YIG nuclease family protein [Noviherbaspirillum malthae]